ncbi:SMI1 / KNR4 family (SUKH-1) [Chitinophaga rupis]|uniref:SMI1 / KNR4 family (SUKH-1) n=1 Tax=Chitinophaga rupis TaxID=573321 RepID=A0A1H7XM29_9BACT|nr:SMI1/KNR4 family protein [Chitinophaga rupis]SEM34725.1 SMI1 / KNR4 family (SUKH-1) [Chitinophaga rupis]
MEPKFEKFFTDFFKPEGADDALIDGISKRLDFKLPGDYLDVMRTFNGGDGEIGKNSYLVLFPINELIETNSDYELLMKQIPGFFLFGKDAADTGYAFRKTDLSYHSFGLMSNFKTDFITYISNDFEGFLNFLYMHA